MKNLLFSALAIVALSSCADKEQLKKEIKEELKMELADNPKVTKGNGSVFYAEPTSIGSETFYKFHSTMSCPDIRNGVQVGWHKTSISYNIFCSTCMTYDLIMTCKSWIEE